jgi:predicted nucleic-acid-binding protein
MITLVDTNVLLDIFLPDPKWGQKSKICLERAFKQGSLIINEIIYCFTNIIIMTIYCQNNDRRNYAIN